MSRTAEIERKTRETEVTLELDLDGGEVAPSTGVGFFDHMLELLGRHGRLGLRRRGDAATSRPAPTTRSRTSGSRSARRSTEALGDRAGIRRYGHAVVPMDEALGDVRDRHLGAPVLPL